MIKRTHYPEEFKRKLGLELASGMTSAGEMSKREGISTNTLYKWRDMAQGIVVTPDEKEILEMRKRLKELEEIVSDQALTIHIFKKTQKISVHPGVSRPSLWNRKKLQSDRDEHVDILLQIENPECFWRRGTSG